MRGGEADEAAKDHETNLYLRDAVVLRFLHGQSFKEIAEYYVLEVWVVEGIVRDHVRPGGFEEPTA